jgi:hypothetical protein
MSGHTPGPWLWDGNWLAGTETEWKSIIWYTNEDDGIHARQPDRDLIESAPDLLAALEECLVLVRLKYGNLDPDVNIIQEKAHAAIDKARGKA